MANTVTYQQCNRHSAL